MYAGKFSWRASEVAGTLFCMWLTNAVATCLTNAGMDGSGGVELNDLERGFSRWASRRGTSKLL